MENRVLFASISFACALLLVAVDGLTDRDPENWDYEKKGRDWTETCRTGSRQSPIHLTLTEALYDRKLEPVYFNYTDQSLGSFVNTGRSIAFIVNRNASSPSIIYGGGLRSVYEFHELHFHWGSSDRDGSEHIIEYERAPLELQLVHFNTRYGSMAEAKAKSDGVAIVAILFQPAKDDNPLSKLGQFMSEHYGTVDHLLETLKPAKNLHSEARKVDLNVYVDEIRSTKFFRYAGSLTEPGCEESVTWTVIAQRLDVAESLLTKFRAVDLARANSTAQPGTNYRTIQRIHGRNVYTNDQAATGRAASSSPPIDGAFFASLLIASFFISKY